MSTLMSQPLVRMFVLVLVLVLVFLLVLAHVRVYKCQNAVLSGI